MAKPGSRVQGRLLFFLRPTVHFGPEPQEQLRTPSEGETVVGREMGYRPSPLHSRKSEQSRRVGALGGSWLRLPSPSFLSLVIGSILQDQQWLRLRCRTGH